MVRATLMIPALLLIGCSGDPCSGDGISAFVDADGDGYGSDPVTICTLEAGLTTVGGDCDDGNADVFPGADEPECNGIDEDCDGIDEGSDGLLFFADLDGDGYGLEDMVVVACEAPEGGWARLPGDCDDNDAGRSPLAQEICNEGIDDDCDGLADDDDASVDPATHAEFFTDSDGDGFGRPGTPIGACSAPVGTVANDQDCDDRTAEVHPDALEICNGIDDDCDTLRDDEDDSLDPTDLQTLWADTDADGFGDPAVGILACTARPGISSANDLDCDDTNVDVNPARTEELCDGLDNDCDASTPDDADRDADGYSTCVDGDCNDLDASVFPDAAEIPGNGIDEDCDAMEDCYQDLDNDGLRGDVAVAVMDPTCTQAPNVPPSRPLDCDDNDPTVVHSGQWETDADLDGFGDGIVALVDQCPDPGPGYVLAGGEIDCDDDNGQIFPGAPDACNDGIDADCDTLDECTTCAEWLASDPTLPSAVYGVRPAPGGPVYDLYCDMDTDGGGWTLVASTFGGTLDDAAGPWHPGLTTLDPTGPNATVWGGLRQITGPDGDLRFACRALVTDVAFAVDLSFYDVPWYWEITTGSDADSCFSEGGQPDPTPARRDNLTGTFLDTSVPYGAGALEGEDVCGDTDDFTVDLDDAGMDFNEADGTDWGEDDGKHKCGIAGVGEAWYLFAREP